MAGDASPKTASAGSTSRFSFIASSMSAFSKLTAQPAPAVLGPAEDDEILNLNVETALFPNGVPADGSTFSPAAFKNLQQNAFGLFAKMQAAYRQQNAMLRELKAEREAEKDELDEAVTRTRHLKMQLEDMARKAAEQEEAIQQLLMELATERRTRADERAAREKGLAAMARLPGVVPAPSEGSMISEDLGVDEEQRRLARRKWRRKSLTMQSVDGETDEESAPEDGSVFSRSRSPTIAASLFEAGGSTADGPTATAQPQQSTLHHSPAASRQTAAATGPKPRTTVQQMSTFQKLLKGISGETVKEDEVYDGPGCRNCKGQDSSVAWNTVSLLRDENKSLKQRVATLETAVESALDLVNGVGA